MKILMVKTMKGSPDGINVFEYAKGKSYDLPQGLAEVFIHEGWAKLVGKIVEEVKEKTIEVPETQIINSNY